MSTTQDYEDAIAQIQAETSYKMLELSWDKSHILTREQLCLNSCLQLKVAKFKWGELKLWVKMILDNDLQLKSGFWVKLIV